MTDELPDFETVVETTAAATAFATGALVWMGAALKGCYVLGERLKQWERDKDNGLTR